MKYNTRNPVGAYGSTDPRDMYDNAGSLDLAINSELPTFQDRLNKTRPTLKGFEIEHQSEVEKFNNEGSLAIDAIVIINAGDFAGGASVTARNQTVLWSAADDGDGNEYRWTGSIPVGGKFVPPGSTPYTTGGVYPDGFWVNVGSTELRAQLLVGSVFIGGRKSADIARATKNIFTPEMFISSATPSVIEQTNALTLAIRAASGGGKVVASGTYNINPIMLLSNEVSDLTIDFLGADVKCKGPRSVGSQYDWEYGVISFHGQRAGTEQAVNISFVHRERTTEWEVLNSGDFAVGEYWELEIDPDNDTDLSGDFSTKLVWRLLMVTRIISSTTVAFDYQRAFDIPIGVKVVYRKIQPVKNIHITNLNKLTYDREYSGSETDMAEASSGIAFKYAVNCSIDGLEYIANPKHAAHFELTNGCAAKRVKMLTPAEISSGGYAVQFEKSIHWSVESCKSARDRHLFDATASSNGKVADCDGSETSNSTYTTHGTYEHDIVYERNKGHFQLAGSGPAYGETSLKITVRDHVGTIYRGVAPGVRDVSIYDSTFNSTMDANLDGLFLQNVVTNNNCRFHSGGNFSDRKNVAINCQLNVGALFMNAPGKELLMFGGKIIDPRNNSDVFVLGGLTTIDTDWVSESTSTSAVNVLMEKLHIKGGTVSGVPFVFSGGLNQSVVICPDLVKKGNREDLSLVRLQKSAGELRLRYSPLKSENTDRHITALDTENEALTYIDIESTEFVGGSIRIDSGALNGGYLSRVNPKLIGTETQFPPPSLSTYSVGGNPTMYGSKNYSLTLVNGDSTSTTVSVPGVTKNDAVALFSFSAPLSGGKMWAEIISNGTVEVYFENKTGSNISTGSGVIRIKCEKFS